MNTFTHTFSWKAFFHVRQIKLTLIGLSYYFLFNLFLFLLFFFFCYYIWTIVTGHVQINSQPHADFIQPSHTVYLHIIIGDTIRNIPIDYVVPSLPGYMCYKRFKRTRMYQNNFFKK